MSSKKHLIVIHGRASKPSEAEKRRLITEALLHGLTRNSPAAAKKVRQGSVKLSVAYYGDISNQVLVDSGKKDRADLPGKDVDHDNGPCELDKSYDDDLALLFARTSFNKRAYQQLLKEAKDLRVLDNVAATFSGVMNVLGLSDNIIRAATPDMGAYLMRHRVQSEIRERLNTHLLPSLEAGDDVCLVSHSMGCIVSYDVLWKYSHMSEYRHIRERKVTRWITLGNPLGEPGVRDNLIDSHFEQEEDKYPTNVERWVNFSAHDDFVSHDGTMADDFKAMTRKQKIGGVSRAAVGSIRDARIYNFWVGTDGSNPHKFHGYLDHPDVAKEIAAWIG